DGDAISVSSAARRFSLPGRSKMPPQLVQLTAELRDVALQLAEHVFLRAATPIDTADTASESHATQSPSRVKSVRPWRSGTRSLSTPRSKRFRWRMIWPVGA